jgi:hypothetical protein
VPTEPAEAASYTTRFGLLREACLPEEASNDDGVF